MITKARVTKKKVKLILTSKLLLSNIINKSKLHFSGKHIRTKPGFMVTKFDQIRRQYAISAQQQINLFGFYQNFEIVAGTPVNDRC